jgi:hypothetical protein
MTYESEKQHALFELNSLRHQVIEFLYYLDSVYIQVNSGRMIGSTFEDMPTMPSLDQMQRDFRGAESGLERYKTACIQYQKKRTGRNTARAKTRAIRPANK